MLEFESWLNCLEKQSGLLWGLQDLFGLTFELRLGLRRCLGVGSYTGSRKGLEVELTQPDLSGFGMHLVHGSCSTPPSFPAAVGSNVMSLVLSSLL